METAGASSRCLTAKQHLILNRWRAILDNVRHLCRSLNAMPDECACGDGRSHLVGSCRCCDPHRAHSDRIPHCENCDALLAALRPVIADLTVETYQFFPDVLEFLGLRPQRAKRATRDAREQHIAVVARQDAAIGVERRLASVIRTLDRLILASEEFRTGCRLSHLQALKAAARDLLREVERLDHSA